MTYEQLLKLLPYLVTFASLIVTAILGIANYRISHDTASLEKERFAHDKAMVYWNEKVTVYSKVWTAVTTAYEGYLSWQNIADDPSEALRKWAVITLINERKGSPDGGRQQRKRRWLAAGDPTQDAIDDLQQRVRDDPDYWLGWLREERKPNFEELEAE